MGRVLVVDDDDAMRRLIRLNLGDAFEIIDTGEPEQALALALEHKPDAILLDLRMPKFSGFQLCQTFSTFCATQLIPLFIVSGEAGSTTRDVCQSLGATGYFEKPVDFDALRKCLERFATAGPQIPRGEMRVRLRVPLKLRGTDAKGVPFEAAVTTENVSMNGFLCGSASPLPVDSVVDVYLVDGRSECAGKARIVRSELEGSPCPRYGCRFTEKTGHWVLQ